MQETQDRLKYLLKLYTNQEISDFEQAELLTLIGAAENDEYIKAILLNMLEEEKQKTLLNKEKWDPVLKQILSKTGRENKRSERSKVYQFSQRKIFSNWKRITSVAAMIVFLIGISVFYLVSKKNEDVGKKNISQSTFANKDIPAPNSSNAVLTLSSGLRIVLDSVGNGMVAQQGSVNVVKLADGQITYNQDTSVNSKEGETSFNTLSNPRGSKIVNLILEDGSKVWLNAESSLRFPTSFKGATRNVEITGEAYFEVTHNENQPFHVSVNNVDVKVLGTHFNINSYDGNIATTLLEGRVKITKGSVSKIIKAGEQARIESYANALIPSIIVKDVDLEEVMAWKKERFAFNNTDLETIMQEMARWYNVDVIYENRISDRYTVNVSRNVPVSQLFNFIEMSGGVHFEIRNKKIIVKK